MRNRNGFVEDLLRFLGRQQKPIQWNKSYIFLVHSWINILFVSQATN